MDSPTDHELNNHRCCYDRFRVIDHLHDIIQQILFRGGLFIGEALRIIFLSRITIMCDDSTRMSSYN